MTITFNSALRREKLDFLRNLLGIGGKKSRVRVDPELYTIARDAFKEGAGFYLTRQLRDHPDQDSVLAAMEKMLERGEIGDGISFNGELGQFDSPMAYSLRVRLLKEIYTSKSKEVFGQERELVLDHVLHGLLGVSEDTSELRKVIQPEDFITLVAHVIVLFAKPHGTGSREIADLFDREDERSRILEHIINKDLEEQWEWKREVAFDAFLPLHELPLEKQEAIRIDELVDAAEAGDIRRVKELILHVDNIDGNRQNQDGVNALHWSAMGGYVEIFKLLLDAGAQIEASYAPLAGGAQSEKIEIVDIYSDSLRTRKTFW